MIVLDEIITRALVRVREYRDRRGRLTESDTIRVLVPPVKEVLGWTAIQIYKLAMLPDERLHEAFREGAE